MIRLICFSKDRPLQLHGYLESLFRALAAPSLVRVEVLVSSGPAFTAAYAEVAAAFPAVRVTREADFAADVLRLIGDEPYTCFGCDDVVFSQPVPVRKVLDKLADERLLGLSLRLGRNLSRSMSAGPMPQPPDLADEGEFIAWDLESRRAVVDWGYPWELNGTVYPTAFARAIVQELRSRTPNTLENDGAGRWRGFTERRRMCSFRSSRLVVPTVNVVQRDFANGICGGRHLTAELLLACYESGLRLDVDRFWGQDYDCIHIADFFLRRA